MPLRTSLCLFVALSITGIAAAQDVPRSSHVWVVTEENHSFEEVIGNPQMPYYNSLLKQAGLATQFYSDEHSSLPALMWFVAGAAVETDNDTVSCQHSEDNVVRELLKRGYSWRSYQEAMPSAGYQGLYGGPNNVYARRHNPLVDFTDVCPGTGQDSNSVPYTQMATDWSDGKTVNYAYITPDLQDDAHDGTLPEADAWLAAHLPAILARPEFGPGGDGLLFVVWDEADLTNDNRCSATVSQGCGGHTATLVIGPQVKAGYQSTVTYHNENVLATVCAAMGLSPCPGAAATAAPMADFFTSNSSGDPTNSVVIASPGNGATIAGQVHLMATASESQAVNQMEVWDNGTKLGWYGGTAVDQIYNLAPGQHTTTVLDVDASGHVLHGNSVTYTVQSLTDGVQVVAPVSEETISGATVHVVAQANESTPISQMQVWDNGVKLGWYGGSTVNTYFSLQPGLHRVTVLDLDDRYQILHQSSVTYTVQ
ncbi:MAG TPA: alkaline phosphatase family protein [Acidobacteriaceae bacterium]|nr:alkaline phosphatase family protein [Acidobacteriaceae bacterium]